LQGRVVQFSRGSTIIEDLKINISRLSSGVYYLKLKTDSKIYQVKIVKD